MLEPLKLRTLSSLAKVFPDEYPAYREIRTLSALKGETVSFQVAFCWEGGSNWHPNAAEGIAVTAESGLPVKLFRVENIPCSLPIYSGHDDNLLRDKPGLFPDLLRPLDGPVRTLPDQWGSIWAEIAVPESAAAGEYPIAVRFGEICETLTLTVLDAVLPEQTLINTHWFHTDCLSTQYGAPVFSERYWELVENYMKTAVEHGINFILTPLFTPPLDTDIGSERPTVQLVDVTVENGKYTFGFELFRQWVETAHRSGIRYFEIGHLFTQWGAAHAPKVMATADGEYKRIFGWETDASSEEYRGFLREMAAGLIAEIDRLGIRGECIFHVSDEPSEEVFESYKSASDFIYELFGDFKIIDALSSYTYYEKGVVRTPIPANNHIDPFIGNVPELWTYYCCGQYRDVSNRFFAMPSARNRILGMQMYKFDVKGFLQWGYNFWYSRQSRHEINPFLVTDGEAAWPAGDPFVVYPGKDGKPLCSLRLKVFREALQDMRALQLLESKIGKEAVIELLERNLGEPITFSSYPKSDEWLLSVREAVNRRIAES